ncbi:MAG TPA: hypothetical protein DD415_01645 [Clostridiales bacterium]|nr:hypothetical protein [Clostridiales bacterium]
MNKNNYVNIKLGKGEINAYDFGGIVLYAYKTNDFIDDEVFILVKNGKGVVIELPCFFDNIEELTAFLNENKIDIVAKLVAYHAAGASFLPDVKAYGTESSDKYNTSGGGAGLVGNFKNAFGGIFDSGIVKTDEIIQDGEIELAGIKFIVKSNSEAYDVEIPEINCVYTHMLGHDRHSIVAGCPHADGIISVLNYYLRKGFDLVLTSHYTPEDLKDVKTKIDYLYALKEISETCENGEEMKKKVMEKFLGYGGLNYLDMTVNMFFAK